jgi:hypothetical protein
VEKSTLRKKIIIGVVERIKVSGEEKCGGAAENKTRISLDANFQNMKVKKTMSLREMQKKDYWIN